MRIDFNPDREGHVKHKFEVIDATRRRLEHIPKYPQYKFGDKGALRLNDEKLAREIQKECGRDVTVTRIRYPDEADRGHTYFFGRFQGLPWATYDDLGRRIHTEEEISQR